MTAFLQHQERSSGPCPIRALRFLQCLIFLSLLPAAGLCQASLLKDINTQENIDENEYSWMTRFNDRLFFVSAARELWSSDGTGPTTARIASFDRIYELKVCGDLLYFTADDGVHGPELWKTDGTAGGTALVSDIVPGGAGSLPQALTDANGILFFTASAGNGRELWKSNGMANGTSLVKDIFPKKGGSNPSWIVPVNSTVFFSANDGVNGYELWKSDGSAGGTVLVRDLRAGEKLGSMPELLTDVDGIVFFTAANEDGRELWKSDGTANGTVQVKDIRAGTSATGIGNMVAVGGDLFFTANDGIHGHELWRSDGSPAGTAMVKDMTPGSAGSHGEHPFMFRMANFTDIGGTLFFTAYQANEYFIWKSDGTAEGTVPLEPSAGFGIGAPETNFTLMNGSIYFLNDPDGEVEEISLFRMDVDGANIEHLSSFDMIDFYNPYYPGFVKVNDHIFISARQGELEGFTLIKSDGTAAGTGEFFDARRQNNGSNPQDFTAVNGNVYFHTQHYEDYWQEPLADGVWKTDGTPEGTTQLIADLEVSDIEPVRNGVFASGFGHYNSNWQLWKTDGLNTERVIAMDNFYGVSKLTHVNGMVFFHDYRGQLWKSDGTAAGTLMLRDLNSITAADAVRDQLIFRVETETYGEELWRSNGTASGTYRFKKMRDGYAAGSFRTPAITIKNVHYFVANDGVHGNEVWATRGSMATTSMLNDFNTSDDNFVANLEHDTSAFGNLRDTLYVSAMDDAGNWSLFKNSGSAMLKIRPLNPVVEMIPGKDKLYMLVTRTGDPYSTDLWVTDGTAESTTMLKELNVAGTRDHALIGDVLYFSLQWTMQLWRTDGTICGTFAVDAGVTHPTDMLASGTDLFLAAASGEVGSEPHVYNTLTAPQNPCGTLVAADESGPAADMMTSYPNPFTDNFTFRMNGPDEELINVSIFTSYGDPVEEISGLKSNMDVALGQSWQPGVYVLKISRRGGLSTRLVIKK